MIDAYFQRLAAHLAANREAVPMDFYGETFRIHDSDGGLAFPRAEMRPGARALPSAQDWREISRRGASALNDAGWRGCFLAHGKVWFETDGEAVGLIAFDKTMPWD